MIITAQLLLLNYYCSIYPIEFQWVSYILSNECIDEWTVCKTLPFCSENFGSFPLHHAHVRKDTKFSLCMEWGSLGTRLLPGWSTHSLYVHLSHSQTINYGLWSGNKTMCAHMHRIRKWCPTQRTVARQCSAQLYRPGGIWKCTEWNQRNLYKWFVHAQSPHGFLRLATEQACMNCANPCCKQVLC